MSWLVEHPHCGYLKLPPNPGGEVALTDELAIVTEPAMATAMGREKAESFAQILNKREDTSVWHAVSWQAAYTKWVNSNGIKKARAL